MNESVLLKYVGGRSFEKVMFNRVAYVFKKENDYSCLVPQKVVEWLSQYAIGQYQVSPTKIKEVIVEVEKKPDLKCECGFIAKSEFGLQAHKRSHKKEE